MWLDRVCELKAIAESINKRQNGLNYSTYTVDLTMPLYSSDLNLDWTELRTKIAKYGLRNSLMIGLMPTESTSIIAGGSKSFEPITGVIFNKQSGNGEFRMTNKHAIQLLTEYGMWNSDTINYIIAHNGSIQGLPGLDAEVAKILLCMNEISQMKYIKLCARIQPWVDQGLSLNITLPDNDPGKFTTLMIMAWLHGLKTGCYYLKCTLTAHAGKLSGIESKVMDLKSECISCAL
jgi:ribonucleoside-diphosphate reductase alpha chain